MNNQYRRLTHSALALNLLLLAALFLTVLVGVGLVLVSRDRPSNQPTVQAVQWEYSI